MQNSEGQGGWIKHFFTCCSYFKFFNKVDNYFLLNLKLQINFLDTTGRSQRVQWVYYRRSKLKQQKMLFY